MKPSQIALCAIFTFALAPASATQAQGWPGVFDPLQLLALHLDMDNADWQTIQNDESLSIEVPAMFWADGEVPILVAVRRKSADPLNSGGGFTKVSLKIDINQFVPGQMWRDLRKLSLENGDDQDVVSEGLAWNLHRFAGGPEGYGYLAGLGSWVTLNINGTDTGVYVNAEQRDKRFLQNRGLHTPGETWLYKVGDFNDWEIKVGGPEDSPTFQALCYSPFLAPNGECPTPPSPVLAAELPPLINMQGILSLGAVNSFMGNPDAIFSQGKNFYFVDFLTTHTRLYFPWDQDSVLTSGNDDIYATGSPYSEIVLAVPGFRAQYSQIMNDLICGPLSEGSVISFLNAVEPILTDPLAADSNNKIDGTVAEHFDELRNWITNRIAEVAAQIENYEECCKNCPDTDTDGDGQPDDVDDDDDNDGVPDVNDPQPLNPDICGDSDGDTCDDCAVGTDDFGPLPDNDPANDGVDTDGDGICDLGDPCPLDNPDDTDGDGVCDSDDICPGGDDTIDTDGDGIPDACDDDISPCGNCPTDVDGSGATGAFDLAALLGAWGSCGAGEPCECLDADDDGTIGAFDLAALLGTWGPCG